MVLFMNKTYKKWTPADIEFVFKNQNMLDKEVAAKLSESTGQLITTSMVRRQRRKGGVIKKRGRPCSNKVVDANPI